jgi:DNA-binding transcriptional MerR regulator
MGPSCSAVSALLQLLHQQHKEELARVKAEAAEKVKKLEEEVETLTEEKDVLSSKVCMSVLGVSCSMLFGLYVMARFSHL